MDECYLCGIGSKKAVLYEGIYKSRGVIHVCRKCYFKEKIPLIEKKEIVLDRSNSRESVRERLSRMAHVTVEKHEVKKIIPHMEDVHLKDIVDRNFKQEVYSSPKPPEDLIDHFNWVVMRKRRFLKISKEKLAESILEPFIAVESLEKGILPKDYLPLIKKVEGYLELNLRKEKGEIDHKDIINESKIPTGILISEMRNKTKGKKDLFIDIRDLSLDKINEIYGIPKDIPKKGFFKEKPKDEPSDEDLSKIVWGK